MFFDIDGTLVSFNTHQIPPSTILALTQAKANGHKVFIATGRPPLIITNLGAIEHLIDGYVTINGALCFIGDEVVRCREIAPDEVQTVVGDALDNDYGLIVIGENDMAVLDPHGDVNRIFGRWRTSVRQSRWTSSSSSVFCNSRHSSPQIMSRD